MKTSHLILLILLSTCATKAQNPVTYLDGAHISSTQGCHSAYVYPILSRNTFITGGTADGTLNAGLGSSSIPLVTSNLQNMFWGVHDRNLQSTSCADFWNSNNYSFNLFSARISDNRFMTGGHIAANSNIHTAAVTLTCNSSTGTCGHVEVIDDNCVVVDSRVLDGTGSVSVKQVTVINDTLLWNLNFTNKVYFGADSIIAGGTHTNGVLIASTGMHGARKWSSGLLTNSNTYAGNTYYDEVTGRLFAWWEIYPGNPNPVNYTTSSGQIDTMGWNASLAYNYAFSEINPRTGKLLGYRMVGSDLNMNISGLAKLSADKYVVSVNARGTIYTDINNLNQHISNNGGIDMVNLIFSTSSGTPQLTKAKKTTTQHNDDLGIHLATFTSSGGVPMIRSEGLVDFDGQPFRKGQLREAGPYRRGVVYFQNENLDLLDSIVLGGSGSSEVTGSFTDSSGILYITGSFSDTVDLDPSPATAYQVAHNVAGIFYAKYDVQTVGMPQHSTDYVYIQVWPIPSSTGFHVKANFKTPADGFLQIEDMTGKLIYRKEFHSTSSLSEEINEGVLTPGIYLVRITTGNEQAVRKAVVMD